jgi:acyl-CoA dehydrogenase
LKIFEVPEQYADLKRRADAVAQDVGHYAGEADEQQDLDPRVVEALRDSGLSEWVVPGAFGGRTEQIDPYAVCIIREAFMAHSAHLDAAFSMQGIGSYAIAVAGTLETQQRWLPLIARAAVIPGLALTEPHVGSDLKNISTTLTQTSDGLRLKGSKSYISNAGAADVYTVLAREGDGFSLVVVPAAADGLTIESGPDLIAPAVIGSLHFDGVSVPESARVGVPGDGFRHVLATLSVFRISMAAAALGLAQAALEDAVKHTMNREAFGRPLARNGVVAQMLADSWTELEMARLLTYRAAEMARDNPGGETLPYSSMGKMAATEMAGRVVDRAVQCMGRFGLEKERRIGRLYRHARPMRLAEGSSEVLRLGITKQLCDITAAAVTDPDAEMAGR